VETDRQELEPDKIWVLVDDLFFSARIRSTATALGIKVALFDSPAQLEHEAPTGVSKLIVDLNAKSFDALPFVRSVKGDPGWGKVPVVAFYSHVDAATRREAEKTGVDRLLTKSEFTRKLPEILQGG
jgi:CheY-like chemotaxis protein